jgi:hypothetical protein
MALRGTLTWSSRVGVRHQVFGVRHLARRDEICGTSSPTRCAYYYRATKLWAGSSFTGSVGGAASIHRQYIEQQNRPG